MKDYVLFVHGVYRKDDLVFYKKLCRGKTKVAVDGGLSFFKKAKIEPDLIIGDMDSATFTPTSSPKTRLVSFPVRKDKTDSQLAIEYCIKQGAGKIDLVQPSVGEPDHFVGNILLPLSGKVIRWGKSGGEFRIVGKSYEARFVANGKVAFSNCKGDIVSVMPFSRTITLTCSGTEYNVSDAHVARGDTRALRNRISTRRAMFSIKGEALVWRIFSR